MISQNRFILCIAVLVGLAAALLGGLAFSLSRHELKYQRQTERDYLEQECRLLANRLHNELDNIRQALTGPVTPWIPASVLQLHPDVTVVTTSDVF